MKGYPVQYALCLYADARPAGAVQHKKTACIIFGEPVDAATGRVYHTNVDFELSLGAGITGMAYGFSSGRYRTDNDVIEGLTQPMKLLDRKSVV